MVVHGAGFAVHDAARGANDGAAKHLADALVPHAHPQQRQVRPKLPDYLQRYPAVLRPPCRMAEATVSLPTYVGGSFWTLLTVPRKYVALMAARIANGTDCLRLGGVSNTV